MQYSGGGSASVSGLKQLNYLSVTLRPGMLQRGYTVAASDARIGPGGQQRAHDVLMMQTSVAKDDRLEESGPSEIVDVVERRTGSDQTADHLVMAQMCGGNKRGAVVGA
jgi:hypothetical protein